MIARKIRATFFALAATAVAAWGMAACSTGTDPGETNVDRGEIHEEGSMVGDTDENEVEAERDTMEQYYDSADHENHEDNTGKVIGDGAYDGEGEGVERDEVDQ